MNTTTITDVRLLQPPDTADTFDVTFAGNAISAVEPAGTATAEGEVVEGFGRTLLPGLIDTHVHLRGRSEMAAATRAGVTRPSSTWAPTRTNSSTSCAHRRTCAIC